jgi:hypothetical protein
MPDRPVGGGTIIIGATCADFAADLRSVDWATLDAALDSMDHCAVRNEMCGWKTDLVLEAVAAVCGGPRDPGPWILGQGLGASLGYQIFRMSIFPDPGLRVRVIAQVCNKLADNVQPGQASRQCHASFLSVPDFLSAARPGCLRALSVSYSKSVLCGAFVWARTPLNGQKWRFPTRADSRR